MKLRKTASEIRAERDSKRLKKKPVKKNKTTFRHSKKPDPIKGMDYKSFLKTGYWTKVRGLVLKRDKFKCRICNETKFLQIHHTTYKNHFNELNHLDDLITLCKDCHKEHHYAQT